VKVQDDTMRHSNMLMTDSTKHSVSVRRCDKGQGDLLH
jgi:hypothetical protein